MPIRFRDQVRALCLIATLAAASIAGALSAASWSGVLLDHAGRSAGEATVKLRSTSLSEKSTMREDVFSLTEGKAIIQWPAPLSEESIQDLKDWLKIVERKISRSAAPGGIQ